MARHTIRRNGIELFARDRGEGLPLLLAHGMWCDHRIFDRMIGELGPSFRTIALDLRGHGRSRPASRPWSVLDLADDLRKVLDVLAIERAVVVGHSLGGMAALHMALACPQRLKALVLLSTSADAETSERRTQLKTLAMTVRAVGPSRWLVRKAASIFFSSDYARRSPESIQRWCTAVRSMGKRALYQAVEAVRTRPSVMDRLDTIQTPALVFCNSGDPICDPDRSRAMAARLANGTARILPGGGHALPMEHPKTTARAIRDFVND